MVERAALEDNAPRQEVCDLFGPFLVDLDELMVDARVVLLDLQGDKQSNVAAAHGDDAARLFFLVAERRQRALHVVGIGGEVDVVAGKHVFVAAGNDHMVAANDADDEYVEVGK